jgi:predicted aspartyl protease
MPFPAMIGGVWMSLLAFTTASLAAQDGLRFTPMEVVHGKPYVMVMVNGRGPFRFVVDTGTGGQALITPELAGQLDLPLAGRVRLTDPSGQGLKDVPVVLVRSLQVAGVEFTGVRAIRHSLPDEDGSCQGLLGFTLFSDYLLTLDYPRRRLALSNGTLEMGGKGSVLAFRMPDGVPIVTLSIDGLRIEAQLDSGGDGLSLPQELASRLKFAVDPVVFANGQSFSTSFQLKEAKLASTVYLGRYGFPKPFVEINSAFPLANFGACPMQNFALTFDQKNLLVRIDASRTTFALPETPTAMHLTNMPPPKPPPPGLVPLG